MPQPSMAVTKPAYDAQGWITADYAEMEVGTLKRGCVSHTSDHLISSTSTRPLKKCVSLRVVRTDNVQGMHTVADQVHAMILLVLFDLP